VAANDARYIQPSGKVLFYRLICSLGALREFRSSPRERLFSFTRALSAFEFVHGRSLPLPVLDLVPDAKRAKNKARGRHRGVAEQTHKDAERQNDPGDIPQNDPIGH
jgi:hypothetical protein